MLFGMEKEKRVRGWEEGTNFYTADHIIRLTIPIHDTPDAERKSLLKEIQSGDGAQVARITID